MRRSLVLALTCALTLLVGCRAGKRSSEPTITSSLAGKADVDLFAPLGVDFDADMDTATLTAESVQLLRGGHPVVAQVSAGARRVEIVVSFGLEPLTAYEIVVTTAAKTRDGRSAAGDVRFAFVTRASVPDDPPRLVASTPSLGAMVVPTTTLALDFDRPLLAASVGAASIFVRPAGLGALEASYRLSADARRVILTMAQLLGAGAHELVVTDALQSSTGAALPRLVVVPFAVRDGFFVVRAEPAAGARLGLGLSRLRVEFNRAPRLGSTDGVRLSRGGVPAPLSVVAQGQAFDLEMPPLDREGEYELSVDDVVDPSNTRLAEPFCTTFTVDAQETGWTVPREIALRGLLPTVSLGTNVAFASNQSGRAAVLWLEADRTASGRHAFVATFDGDSWSAPLALTTGASDIASPRIAINAAFDVIAVWSEHTGATATTRARLRTREQWGMTQQLTDMARALVVELAANGDATVLGTRDREVDLLACASVGGSFQATYVLFAGFSVATAPTDVSRWQHDDSGRRLVVFSHEDGKGFRLRATWLVPGQGATTSVPIFDGSAFYVTVHENVTPGGDAVVIFSGARRGQRSDLFAQCFRSGTWLPDAQASGSSLLRDDVLVSGRSGDTILLASRVEAGRARPHARLLRASLGAFDAGRSLDEGGEASIDGLRLFGTPDAQATAYFDRADQTGSFTVQSTWDRGAGVFSAGERATTAVPHPRALAHDRDGNAVMLVGDAGLRFVQGAGFVAERRNPFPVVPEATAVVSRYGRVDLIGVRTEQRGAERYDFLRVTSYR